MRSVHRGAFMLGVLVAAFGGDGVLAQEMALQPFSYQEGFEGDCPTLDLWANSGPSTVVFSGPTNEKAFEGERSLKLDVTLEGGSYHYFGAPCKVPCAGSVKLSARVWVAEGTTARVGFGTNVIFPPTHHSGCAPDRTFEGPTGGWEYVETDLVERGTNGANGVMSRHTATTRGEDVGAYLDRWSLFILGGEGKRAVVYLDDVRIEGQVPSEEDYRAEIDRRWSKAQERLSKRIAEWRTQIDAGRAAFAALKDLPEQAQGDATLFEAGIGKAERLVDKFAETGYGSRQELTQIDAALFTVRYGPETIAAIQDGIANGRPMLLYTPAAITNQQFATNTFPIPARIGEKLACSGCRDEYESVSLAAFAFEDLKQVRVSASDLGGPAGTIPAEAVDIHVVKCWYQAAKEIWSRTKAKLLVPELLLKDDRLVRVDLEKKENYLRSTAEDGTETYLLCSGPTSENLEGVRPLDATELLPVDIPARTLKQFWLTVHIPADAAAGLYRGEVALAWEGGARTIPLEVTVHPFGLLPSRLVYSIYYRAKLSQDGQPTIGSEYKSEEQYLAELKDFKAHGVLYPTNYHKYDEAKLRRILEMRREAGLPTDRFYNLGCGTGSPTTEAELVALARDVKTWIEFCRPFGYEQVYFYGIDEARGERLEAQRNAWRAVQDAGGKTFVACYYKTFEAMGDRLNCAVLAGRPDPDEAKKWHSVGSHAFCYAYPQVGNEEPETYRRHFGLVLWKAGFDGAMDYAYQHGFAHVWNDYDHDHYRDHNFTYPTVHGVVGTVQWDGFREAVDDVRYVTTLEHAIEHAPDAKAAVAEEARAWLDTLDPDTADLYAARVQMVEFIEKMQ